MPVPPSNPFDRYQAGDNGALSAAAIHGLESFNQPPAKTGRGCTHWRTQLLALQVGAYPGGLAVSPSGDRLYVACSQNTPGVGVFDTTFDTVIAKVPGASFVAVDPSGERVYVS